MQKPWELDWSGGMPPEQNLLPIVPFFGTDSPGPIPAYPMNGMPAHVDRQQVGAAAQLLVPREARLAQPAPPGPGAVNVGRQPPVGALPAVSRGMTAVPPRASWDLPNPGQRSLATGMYREVDDPKTSRRIEAMILAGRNRDPVELENEINDVIALDDFQPVTGVAAVLRYSKPTLIIAVSSKRHGGSRRPHCNGYPLLPKRPLSLPVTP